MQLIKDPRACRRVGMPLSEFTAVATATFGWDFRIARFLHQSTCAWNMPCRHLLTKAK
jgi:hypothetical protein